MVRQVIFLDELSSKVKQAWDQIVPVTCLLWLECQENGSVGDFLLFVRSKPEHCELLAGKQTYFKLQRISYSLTSIDIPDESPR